MKTSKQVVQLTGDLPSCHIPPESQDTFDWNNFDDYSVGSSSQGYFSPGYQEGGNTRSEMSLYSNREPVSSQRMTPMSSGSSQIIMNEDIQNTDTQKSNRNKIFLYKIFFFFTLDIKITLK